MMKSVFFSITAITVLATSALAESKLSPCRENRENATWTCELRLDSASEFKGAKLISGDKSVGVDFTSFDTLKPPPSMYFLLDNSKLMEPGSFQRLKNVILRTIKPGNTSFAVYTFTRGIKQIAPLGTPVDTIRLALNSVNQSGDLTEGLASINDLLPTIEQDQSEKKSLVILSDGDFSDSAYTTREIIEKLKRLNVSVYSVSPKNNSEAISSAQPIRRIAAETGGDFLTSTGAQSTENTAKRLTATNENGGILKFSSISKNFTLNIDLASTKISVDITADGWQPPKTVESIPSEPETLKDKFKNFASVPINLALIVGGLLFLAITLIWIVVLLRRRRKMNAEVELVSALTQSPLAFLEFLDGNSSKEPVYAGSLRVGRSEDNDLVLRNTSVHRQHAVLSRSNQGVFSITDLNTQNGVFVNGSRIQSAELNDGDLIELGEVRLRFRLA